MTTGRQYRRYGRRFGTTLVHVQAAIAVGAIVIASVATSLAALYRLQTTTDELRERSAVGYRFEHRFREDAREAESVEQTDQGALIFHREGGDVQYVIKDGDLLRTVELEDVTARDVMLIPDGVQAELKYDADAASVQLTVAPDGSNTANARPTLARRVRSTIGRPQIQAPEVE